MITGGPDIDRRAADLRAAFDDAFARSPPPTEAATEDLLAIRVSGDPYAVRVRELTGLLANRRVVPLPSRKPELLGVAGVRGALVSVYGLSSILGYSTRSIAMKWLAMCGHAQSVALAFDELEGFLRLPQRSLFRVDSVDTSRPHLAEAVRVGPTTRRVIDTRSILNFLGLDAGSPGPT